MKSQLLFLLTLLIAFFTQAQNLLEADKNTIIESCDTYLYDDGGEDGDYTAYFKGSFTVKPDVPGKVVELNYENFELTFQARWNIYNGTIDDPLIFTEVNPSISTGHYFYGNPNENGAITLELDVSEATAAHKDEGFKIKVSCVDAYPTIDLSFSNFSVSDTIVAGDPILTYYNYSISDNDFNKTIAANYKTAIYLSDDKIIDDNDLELDTEFKTSTSFSGSGNSFYTDFNTTEGWKFVLYQLDADEVVPETDETNNLAIDSVYIKESKPDLEVVKVELEKDTVDPAKSESLEWTAFIKNKGNQRTFTYSSYYISTDSIIPTSTQSGVKFGGTAHFYEIGDTTTDDGDVSSFNLKNYATGDKYYLIIHADDYGYLSEYDLDGKYVETDEENNWYIKPFWIYGEKDSTFKMPKSGTKTLVSCDTVISDAGGSKGETIDDYNDGILVLKPSAENMKIKLEFIYFDYDDTFDDFYVYNGSNTSINDYYNITSTSPPIIADNPEGTLTLQVDMSFFPAEGFIAQVSCETITSISNFEDVNKSNIYPNPSTDYLNIPSGASEIKIYNLSGQLISSYNSTTLIDVQSLSNGKYLLEYVLDNNTEHHKFVKK